MQQIDAFKIQERRKKKRGEGGRERGRGREGATGQEGKKGSADLLSFSSENWRNTIALRLQQPTAYKPMSEESCQTVLHTSTLTHYPIDQLYNAPCYKLFSCEGNWLFQCLSYCIKKDTSQAPAIVHVLSSLRILTEVGLSLHLYLQCVASI